MSEVDDNSFTIGSLMVQMEEHEGDQRSTFEVGAEAKDFETSVHTNHFTACDAATDGEELGSSISTGQCSLNIDQIEPTLFMNEEKPSMSTPIDKKQEMSGSLSSKETIQNEHYATERYSEYHESSSLHQPCLGLFPFPTSYYGHSNEYYPMSSSPLPPVLQYAFPQNMGISHIQPFYINRLVQPDFTPTTNHQIVGTQINDSAEYSSHLPPYSNYNIKYVDNSLGENMCLIPCSVIPNVNNDHKNNLTREDSGFVEEYFRTNEEVKNDHICYNSALSNKDLYGYNMPPSPFHVNKDNNYLPDMEVINEKSDYGFTTLNEFADQCLSMEFSNEEEEEEIKYENDSRNKDHMIKFMNQSENSSKDLLNVLNCESEFNEYSLDCGNMQMENKMSLEKLTCNEDDSSPDANVCLRPERYRKCKSLFKKNVSNNLRSQIISASINIRPKLSNLNQILTCTKCDYTSFNRSNFKNHLFIHSEERLFACPHCSYKGKQSAGLRAHLKVHSLDKPFNCAMCNYRCKRKQNLIQHLRIHNKHRPFSCTYCDYTSTTKQSLQKHMIKHYGGETPKIYLNKKVTQNKLDIKAAKHEESISDAQNSVNQNGEKIAPEQEYLSSNEVSIPGCVSDQGSNDHLEITIQNANELNENDSLGGKGYDYGCSLNKCLHHNDLKLNSSDDLTLHENTHKICDSKSLKISTNVSNSKESHRFVNFILQCPYCTYECSKTDDLRFHISNHKDEDYQLFTRPLCNGNNSTNVKKINEIFLTCETNKDQNKELQNTCLPQDSRNTDFLKFSGDNPNSNANELNFRKPVNSEFNRKSNTKSNIAKVIRPTSISMALFSNKKRNILRLYRNRNIKSSKNKKIVPKSQKPNIRNKAFTRDSCVNKKSLTSVTSVKKFCTSSREFGDDYKIYENFEISKFWSRENDKSVDATILKDNYVQANNEMKDSMQSGFKLNSSLCDYNTQSNNSNSQRLFGNNINNERSTSSFPKNDFCASVSYEIKSNIPKYNVAYDDFFHTNEKMPQNFHSYSNIKANNCQILHEELKPKLNYSQSSDAQENDNDDGNLQNQNNANKILLSKEVHSNANSLWNNRDHSQNLHNLKNDAREEANDKTFLAIRAENKDKPVKIQPISAKTFYKNKKNKNVCDSVAKIVPKIQIEKLDLTSFYGKNNTILLDTVITQSEKPEEFDKNLQNLDIMEPANIIKEYTSTLTPISDNSLNKDNTITLHFQNKKESYDENKNRENEETGDFSCNTCESSFRKKSSLVNHKRSHTKDTYVCSKCPFTFRYLKAKEDHEGIHSNEMAYKCILCNFTTLNKLNLTSHEQLHKKLKCEHCIFSCNIKKQMEEHSKHHEINEPNTSE